MNKTLIEQFADRWGIPIDDAEKLLPRAVKEAILRVVQGSLVNMPGEITMMIMPTNVFYVGKCYIAGRFFTLRATLYLPETGTDLEASSITMEEVRG